MNRAQFVKEYARWLEDGSAAFFVGAGMSQRAGYPDWRSLLKDIANELDIDIASEHDLAGVAQWYINKSGRQRTRIAQVIKDAFPDRNDAPAAHRTMARLPVRHVWTTNYDKLIERAWQLQRRAFDVKAVKSDLSVSGAWADTTLYKMHGSVDHPAEAVVATDDYELYRHTRAGFLHVLNGHLIALHFLFVGFSFTDPNIGHLLALIRESMGEHPTQHYAIVRKPRKNDGDDEKLWAFKRSRHAHWIGDLQRYGINCVEVEDYEEIDSILAELEAVVSRRSVFVSGSYPEDLCDERRAFVEGVATGIGRGIGDRGLRLVSGFGLTVGSAAIGGVLDRLYSKGAPSLERHLHIRPFPQQVPEGFSEDAFRTRYREDLIQQAGICVFLAGVKDGASAQGVIKEYEVARALGKVLIPVAATSGAAAEVWDRLKQDGGAKAAGLSDDLFAALGNTSASVDDSLKAAMMAIDVLRPQK